MTFKTLVKQVTLHIIVFTVLLFVAFNAKENGDMNVVIFGTFIYLPYVFLLIGVNFLLMVLGVNTIKKRPHVFLTVLFTSAILTIWFLLCGGTIEIRYWKFSLKEFVALNILILILNTITITRLTIGQMKNDKN